MEQESSGTVLELLLAGDEPMAAQQNPGSSGVIVARLAGFSEAGMPLVEFSGADGMQRARTMVGLDRTPVGSEVVVAFERGEVRRPIVIGVLWDPSASPAEPEKSAGIPGLEADLDGESVVLTAKREIVLRCGKSSITLTRAGKVLIRGAYLLNRSSGVNRIKGGSVQIN